MNKPTMSPTKKKIFEEAARLFQEKGYPAASMRDLASRVELSVSSLYSHIGGKEEILQKICFDNARHYLRVMEKVESSTKDPAGQVKTLIRQHIHIALEDITSVTVFNDEWRHLSEPYLSEFVRMRKDYERRFIRIIVSGQEKGQFAPIDPTIALFTMLTSLRWLHQWYPSRKGISKKTLETSILAMLMKGLEMR